MPGHRLLIVFVKAPRPGFVKSRLAQTVGPEAACLIYQILVSRVLKSIESLNPVEVRFSPDHAEKEIRPWRRTGWTVAAQGPGDLGQRLMRAFRDAFAAGYERVAIIGSDSPEITHRDVEDAWAALDAHDLVVGPTLDGGYWLIAVRRGIHARRMAQLFRGIPWSTQDVFEKTVEKAVAASLSVHRLRELSDIDTEDDWKEYLRRNALAEILPRE
jgi:rSAM/selenodomain-associated transferase 1